MERRRTTSTRLTPSEHDLIAHAAAMRGQGIAVYLRGSAVKCAQEDLADPAVFVGGRRVKLTGNRKAT